MWDKSGKTHYECATPKRDCHRHHRFLQQETWFKLDRVPAWLPKASELWKLTSLIHFKCFYTHSCFSPLGIFIWWHLISRPCSRSFWDPDFNCLRLKKHTPSVSRDFVPSINLCLLAPQILKRALLYDHLFGIGWTKVYSSLHHHTGPIHYIIRG